MHWYTKVQEGRNNRVEKKFRVSSLELLIWSFFVRFSNPRLQDVIHMIMYNP
jgi:hypothetical protein